MNYVLTWSCHSATVSTRPAILALRLSCTALHPHAALSCPVSPTPSWPAATACRALLLWPWRGGVESSHILTSFPQQAELLCLPSKVLIQSRATPGSVAAPGGSGSGNGNGNGSGSGSGSGSASGSGSGRESPTPWLSGGRDFTKRREQCPMRSSWASGREEDHEQTHNIIWCCSIQTTAKSPRQRSQPASEVCGGLGRGREQEFKEKKFELFKARLDRALSNLVHFNTSLFTAGGLG